MTENVQISAPEVLPIPVFNASSVHIASTGTDVMLIFSAFQPTLGNKGIMKPVAAISLSRGAATDLETVLKGILDTVEKDLGPINTPFLKERRETQK